MEAISSNAAIWRFAIINTTIDVYLPVPTIREEFAVHPHTPRGARVCGQTSPRHHLPTQIRERKFVFRACMMNESNKRHQRMCTMEWCISNLARGKLYLLVASHAYRSHRIRSSPTQKTGPRLERKSRRSGTQELGNNREPLWKLHNITGPRPHHMLLVNFFHASAIFIHVFASQREIEKHKVFMFTFIRIYILFAQIFIFLYS